MRGFEITGWVARILLSLPILALLLAAYLATRKRRPPPGPRWDGAKEEAAAPAPATARAILSERIARAEAADDERTLVDLYLEMGREEVEGGREKEAAESLRKCIRLASKLGIRDAHARARLELGDIAKAAGDLTTACEHWQMARGLYFELKDKHALAASETRMRNHGCPTDWVLNDF